MGNASSSQSSSQAGTSSPHPSNPTTTQDAPAPRPTSTSAQPISSRPAVATSSTFHSGLTPPTSPPSPPPPGTPVLMPFAGHLSPQNPHCLSHPQAHDYSRSTVTRLILDGKLAPFYRGLEDFEEDWSEDRITKVLDETREKDYEDGVENSHTEKLKEDREGGSSTVGSVAKKIGINKSKEQKRAGERDERLRRERKAYVNAVECPICFLNYPPNINTSRCCQQPVCTECFVQIKRSEATITHLESDPACCPFCMETDFGVIYERPIGPMDSGSSFALATSPASEAGASGFSQALSLGSEAELNLGPGMNPKTKETVRRKSVSSKAPEVVTIDEIRPDWEQKLNAVKAAAARRASRRIVMRQVGDRLIPIGFTSSRAPGTADFSMSVGQNVEPPTGTRRSSRRESNRERELEELMIMEAMRLSMVDHEDHQRKLADERRQSNASNVMSPLNPASASAASLVENQPSPGPASRRASSATDKHDKPTGASKLLSKINNVRARASSSASGRSVTFASSTTPPLGSGSGSPSGSPVAQTARPVQVKYPQPPGVRQTAGTGTGLSPTSPAPIAVAPVTTLASPGARREHQYSPPEAVNDPASSGLPRLSLDMPALTPEPAASRYSASGDDGNLSRAQGKMPSRQPLQRMESEMSEATIGPATYAHLDSDEE
ncbi:hypothetical protein IAU60_002106 [Kwoniella sp. DSM 27419]